MRGLLNETVVRVVLMVKVKSPDEPAMPIAMVPTWRSGPERLLEAIGYLC
jgi:hypothetical protein